jgi:23S rRNA (adenine2030-N6)-methyltransferase
MANRHFGELGDVWKHLPLAEVLRLKPPLHYWETHAGSAAYTLTETPTRLHGAIRFLSCAQDDPDLAACSYLDALRTLPGIYPGSPSLAMRALGQGARYLFCDTDPESVQSLRKAAAHIGVRVVEEDGVSTIRREAAIAGVSPSDVLVHIDPYEPHERLTPDGMTPVELAASLAGRGYRVFYWYGYDSIDKRAWARKEISRLVPEVDLWCGDLLIPSPFVYPERSGVWGCGVVLANMTATEVQMCARLGRALERIRPTTCWPATSRRAWNSQSFSRTRSR